MHVCIYPGENVIERFGWYAMISQFDETVSLE